MSRPAIDARIRMMPFAASSHRKYQTAFFFICVAWAISLVAVLTPRACAQDEAGAASATEVEVKPADTSAGMPNLFKHIMKSAGFVFGPLMLVVSTALVALIVLLAMDLRMTMAIPPAFVDEFTDTVNKRRFREAYDLAKNDSSFLGRVLTAGMGRLQYGIEDARETAYHSVDSIKATKEQLITYLATIGSLGPMLGLVGTVFGMIQSFMALSVPGKRVDPQELASGISHALVITLLGIGLAVPAIFCHAFFRNRLIRISMDTANVADDLLTQMFHNSRRPAAGVETARTAPARAEE
jgi:biopolymer transport protein ExbB